MSLFFLGELRPTDLTGNLAALASGICFAFFTLCLRYTRSKEINPASSVIYGNLLLAAFTAPTFIEQTGLHISRIDLLIAIYLGVVQIGIAYILFTSGISHGARSLDATIICFIEPILNPVWVFLFIGEKPTAWAIIGGSIIIAAISLHTFLQVHKEVKSSPDEFS
jgi:drug/metabolite transporter, DME family